MKFSKLGLLTLLISLFILNSCKKQDAIGLGVDEENQLNGTIFADTSVLVNTVLDDTVATSALLNTPLAYFKDPELGTTEANVALGLTLPGNTTFTPPTGTVTIDSTILVLPYAPGFYGDSLATQFKVEVHQLNEQILANRAYYNNKAWNFNTAVVGSRSFAARPHDTLKIFNIIKGRQDTLYKVVPQLRVPIDPAFINASLFNASTAQLASTAAFQSFFKGLYLTLNQSQTTGPGGNLFFGLDSAKISIHYRVNNGTTTDTLLLTMPVQGALHAAQIKHTYSTKVQAALANTSTTGLFYLQGLAGLRAKVNFPDLKNIIAALGTDVVINRAELVISPQPGSAVPYAPLPRINMYQLDIAKQRSFIQDGSSTDIRQAGALNFGGFYNNKSEYHFIVTSYIQDLLRGKTIDYGTYLSATDPVTTAITDISQVSYSSILPTAQFAGRTIAPGKNSPYRIKLNIIYTKINK